MPTRRETETEMQSYARAEILTNIAHAEAEHAAGRPVAADTVALLLSAVREYLNTEIVGELLAVPS
jgi:hypothetical protein